MSGSLWTGPVHDPRRYRVALGPDGPTAEPGSGGDGLLYRAWSTFGAADGAERAVALKVKLHFRVPDPTELARRAAILAALDDPHLMKVIDAFAGCALNDDDDHDPDDFDLCWVVSEWVEGTRLDELHAQPADALRLVAQLARGVQTMHDTHTSAAPHGIVHRDIKAANVLVSDAGRAVLIDYGSAGPLHEVWVTDGTASWLAPEVAAGHEAGIAADIWGVGAVAHTLITGSPPLLDGAACSRERLVLAFTAAERPVHHTQAVAEHLATLLETDPGKRPQNLRAWADQLDALLTRPRRRTVGLVAAALVAAAVVVGVVATSSSDRDEPARVRSAASVRTTTSTATPRVCAHGLPGGVPPELAAAVAALGPDTCAAGTIEHLAMATIAPLTTADGTPADVLLVSPGQPVMRLTSAEYTSYREIAGKAQPQNSVTFGGYPTKLQTTSDPDGVTMELTSGGLVAGRRADTQMFWVPQQARAIWEGEGGLGGTLGFPTSNVFLSGGELRLEFEHGYFTAKLDQSQAGAAFWLPFDISKVGIIRVDDPGADLQGLGDLRGHVLRQAGSTAWFIDHDLVRHWIPDGGTYVCLDAEKQQLGADIPGYAVATLELGPPATCDMK